MFLRRWILFVTRGQTLQYNLIHRKQTNIIHFGGGGGNAYPCGCTWAKNQMLIRGGVTNLLTMYQNSTKTEEKTPLVLVSASRANMIKVVVVVVGALYLWTVLVLNLGGKYEYRFSLGINFCQFPPPTHTHTSTHITHSTNWPLDSSLLSDLVLYKVPKTVKYSKYWGVTPIHIFYGSI